MIQWVRRLLRRHRPVEPQPVETPAPVRDEAERRVRALEIRANIIRRGK